jgi:hypothetical protein
LFFFYCKRIDRQTDREELKLADEQEAVEMRTEGAPIESQMMIIILGYKFGRKRASVP